MTHALGQFLVQEATIPAGSDQANLFRVFTAGESAVSIQFMQYYGGDSSEQIQLFLVPANTTFPTKPSITAGTLAITTFDLLRGGISTIDHPAIVNLEGRFFSTMIPPYSSLAVNMSAGNTAAWVVTVGGFEINA